MREVTESVPGTILLVEDDEQVRLFIRTLLRNDNYSVLEASTGGEGLRLGESHAGRIDLLLSDMLLPELSGIDLAHALTTRFPELRVLFITGYVEGDIVQRAMQELDATFLDKPFKPSALLESVRHTIARDRRRVSVS